MDEEAADIDKKLKNLKTESRRIPGSRRKKTLDAEELLDEAIDDRCQGRKSLK